MTMGLARMEIETPASRSQAGHNGPAMPEGIGSAELLRAVRLDRLESFLEFSRLLSGLVGKHISKPYLIAMEQGKRRVSAEIECVLWRLAAQRDSADPDVMHARAVSIRTTHRIAEGALISADSKPCDRPGCQESFVPTNPFQRYHSPYCREQYRKERGGR